MKILFPWKWIDVINLNEVFDPQRWKFHISEMFLSLDSYISICFYLDQWLDVAKYDPKNWPKYGHLSLETENYFYFYLWLENVDLSLQFINTMDL